MTVTRRGGVKQICGRHIWKLPEMIERNIILHHLCDDSDSFYIWDPKRTSLEKPPLVKRPPPPGISRQKTKSLRTAQQRLNSVPSSKSAPLPPSQSSSPSRCRSSFREMGEAWRLLVLTRWSQTARFFYSWISLLKLQKHSRFSMFSYMQALLERR